MQLASRLTHFARACLAVLALAIVAMPGANAQTTAAGSDISDVMASLPVVDGRRVALVIGNSTYPEQSGWGSLPNAVSDAEHIAALLGDPARGDARFDVELVTDGSLDTIINAVTTFAERAANADVALVYFAGHGFEYGRDNFIVPSDAPPQITGDTLNTHYINMNTLITAADARGITLMFLDACRSPGELDRILARSDSSQVSLFNAVSVPNSMVIYATGRGQPAYDAAPVDADLSPFATAVGQSLGMRGIDLPYMFAFVKNRVSEATRVFEPQQIPQLFGSWDARFYFLPPQVGESQASGTLDIPFETLATVDEPILLMRVLEEHSAADLISMAENGDPIALYLVGYMYEFGVAVERDLAEARRWLELAANTGHPAGQLELGYFLSRHGMPYEQERALRLLRQSAAQHYPKAMSHLAAMLITGRLGETDVEEATRLYHQAADSGHAWARYALYLRNIDRDAQVANLTALAESGNDEGHNWLCEISASHAIENAFGHCEQAALAGYTVPRAYTARMYARGTGVEQSNSQARFWAQVALGSVDLSDMLQTEMRALLGE